MHRRFPKGDRKALWSRPQARFPPATIKIKYENVQGEGVKGATANFIRFHCPLVASAEAKSPACGRKQACLTAPLCLRHQQLGRAHLARQYASGRMCGLGARLRTRKVTGRDASLPAPLLWRFPLNWSPAEQLGRCPNPQQGRCPCTLQGALPLDPFWAARLGCVRLTALTCCLYPKSALHMTRCPGRHRAPPSPSNPVSDPHTRGLSPPKSSHCPTISAGMSQF